MRDGIDAQRARITGVTLTYECPACEVSIDDHIEADGAEAGGFEVPLEERFDLCSHCGVLLDFGMQIVPVAA